MGEKGWNIVIFVLGKKDGKKKKTGGGGIRVKLINWFSSIFWGGILYNVFWRKMDFVFRVKLISSINNNIEKRPA